MPHWVCAHRWAWRVASFLLAMDQVFGGIEVEHPFFGCLRERCDELPDQNTSVPTLLEQIQLISRKSLNVIGDAFVK